jgi:hypothetical protein
MSSCIVKPLDWHEPLDPTTLFKKNGNTVQFNIENANVFSPPMVAKFPNLVLTKDELQKLASAGKLNTAQMSVTIEFNPRSESQREFRKWIDALDDALLDFAVQNPDLLGKPSFTREQLSALQYRAFQQRIGKNGVVYNDSWTCRRRAVAYRAGDNKNNVDTAIIRPMYFFNDKKQLMDGSEISDGNVIQVYLTIENPSFRRGAGFGNRYVLQSVRKISDSSPYMFGDEDKELDPAALGEMFPDIEDDHDAKKRRFTAE